DVTGACADRLPARHRRRFDRARIECAPRQAQHGEREDRQAQGFVQTEDRNHAGELRQCNHDQANCALHEDQEHGSPVEEFGDTAPIVGSALDHGQDPLGSSGAACPFVSAPRKPSASIWIVTSSPMSGMYLRIPKSVRLNFASAENPAVYCSEYGSSAVRLKITCRSSGWVTPSRVSLPCAIPSRSPVFSTFSETKRAAGNLS